MTNPTIGELLEEAFNDLPTEAEASAEGRPAKRSSLRTKQFTLISLPCLTVYLQGASTNPLPELTADSLPDFLAAAHAAGVLKLRRLGYPPMTNAERGAVQESFALLASSAKLFTEAHLTLLKEILAECPSLAASAGGLAAFQTKALNKTSALEQATEWLAAQPALLASLPPEPTVPDLSVSDLDSLSLI